MHTGPVLEVDSLSKRFGGIAALSDANIDLLPGEVHALTGENGAGKSTLIKILAGMVSRDNGRILIDGNEVRIDTPEASQNLGIAVIHQDFDLAANLSVAGNLLLGREPTHLYGFINRRKHQALAERYLHNVGLKIDPDTLVENLSVSQRQLLAIAKSVSTKARILVMDEPSSALASDEIEFLLRLITTLKQQGTSIIYISHKLDEIFRISDRITVLRDGETIGTRETRNTSSNGIISMMVGRELKDLFSKAVHTQEDVLLQIKGTGKQGVFNDISFTLNKGEVLGLYGLKGAGRSEMAATLFGLDSPDKGELLLEGEGIKIKSPQDAIRRGIGFVPEDRKTQGLFPNMNVKENMTISGLDLLSHHSFINKRQERDVINEYTALLNIRTSDANQMITGLSGGNQQKVILARWLLGNPKLLILDEPTAGIDIGAKSEIYKLINRLTSEGMGVILISSELPEILGISDRILIMHNGNITGHFHRNEASEEKVMRAIHS